jgi:GT2 family glycosyltransferase
VAVVICAYTLDRWSDIVTAVDSLKQQVLQPAEVVLVVDHNDALAARAVKELPRRFDRLRIIPSTGRQGLSGARNTGIAATTTPLVAFLDDDAQPAPTWLAELLKPFADPAVWIVGGRAEPVWQASRPAWWPEEFDWVVGCSHRGLPEQTAEVRNVIGCSMALRREVFAVAGLFRADLGRVGTKPVGCEETELCIRLRQHAASVRITYTPHAVVGHRVSGSRARVGYFLARCYAEGVSKAQISRIVGSGNATSSERAYVTRVLPRAVLRALSEVGRGHVMELTKVVALALGLFTTAWGFLGYKVGNTWRQ